MNNILSSLRRDFRATRTTDISFPTSICVTGFALAGGVRLGMITDRSVNGDASSNESMKKFEHA